jgi:hypothetical protein
MALPFIFLAKITTHIVRKWDQSDSIPFKFFANERSKNYEYKM